MNYLGLLPSSGGTSLTVINTGVGASAASAAAERIDRGATWSDPEVDELLNIWTNGNVQAELKEATIKKHIFERIARTLRDKGFYRTAEQCREKIKRLKKEYRQAMNNNYRCVRGRATVKFFPRLQAVLDGSRTACPKSYFEGTTTTTTSTTTISKIEDSGQHSELSLTTPNNINSNNINNYVGLKFKSRSPHSYSECSAEEIKVEVNPAEVDDSYTMDSPNPVDHLDMNRRGFINHRSSLPVMSLNIPSYNHLSRHLGNLQVPRRIRTGLSNGISPTSNMMNATGPVNLCTADYEHDDQDDNMVDEDDGSSAGSITPTDQNSPEPDFVGSGSGAGGNGHNRKRKLNRKNAGIDRTTTIGSSQSANFKDTLDSALDRFLRHQRESEERLFAWEERRIQMELEAEERFRQEDREMLRQIFTNLQTPPSTTNPEPSPSSSGGSHSNDR